MAHGSTGSGSTGSDDTGPSGSTGSGSDGSDDTRRTTTHSAPMTGWQRLSQTFFNPPKQKRRPGAAPEPVDFSKMTDAEIRTRITQIDDTERKIGLAAAILAAIFALIYTVPYMVSKIAVATTIKPVHKTCADHLTYVANGKGPATCNGVYPASHYVFPLVIWLVFALAIYVTVRIGRRAPVAFAIVLTGLAFGTPIIILPFVLAGGWLLLRAWRTQRYGSPTAKAPIDGYVRPGPRAGRGTGSVGSRTGTGTTNGPRRSGRRGQLPTPDITRVPPTPNKRYTPKAPPKKKIPPPE